MRQSVRVRNAPYRSAPHWPLRGLNYNSHLYCASPFTSSPNACSSNVVVFMQILRTTRLNSAVDRHSFNSVGSERENS